MKTVRVLISSAQIFLLACATQTAQAQQKYTPLPIVCKSGGVAGGAVSTCTAEKYDLPTLTDLVRWCPKKTSQCAATEMQLTQWVQLADSELVDGCRDPALVLGEVDHGKCLDWEQQPKYVYPKADYFVGAPQSGQAPLTVLLKWAVGSGATSCLASNGWTGNKGAQGEETVVASANTSYKLECTAPSGTGAARVSWTPPTQNVDGTPLTTLAGFRIQYGNSATLLNQFVEVPGAAVKSFDVTNLSPGKWFFTVTSYTSNGLESGPSNQASKDIAATTGITFSNTVAVTVTNPVPKPKAPTDITVTNPSPNAPSTPAPATQRRRPSN
jgi:Fibronectin type III domain